MTPFWKGFQALIFYIYNFSHSETDMKEMNLDLFEKSFNSLEKGYTLYVFF